MNTASDVSSIQGIRIILPLELPISRHIETFQCYQKQDPRLGEDHTLQAKGIRLGDIKKVFETYSGSAEVRLELLH